MTTLTAPEGILANSTYPTTIAEVCQMLARQHQAVSIRIRTYQRASGVSVEIAVDNGPERTVVNQSASFADIEASGIDLVKDAILSAAERLL